MTAIIERLREIWTPDKEVAELVADLDPQTELDSLIRDFFCRIVRKIEEQGRGPLVLDLSEPNPGYVSWEIVEHNGRTVANITWSLEQGNGTKT